MSAAEKLRALQAARPAIDQSNAMYRLVAPSKWERARDVETVMDVLPQIVAVVEAAEAMVPGPYVLDEGPALVPMERVMPFFAALAALDEELP